MNVEIKITCGLCGMEMEVKRNVRIYDHELEYTAWCPECHSKLEDINRAEDNAENKANQECPPGRLKGSRDCKEFSSCEFCHEFYLKYVAK